MIDVAREAGVSLKTVSRAVNAVPSLDPELAGRVFEAIRVLGYRRNDVAARLRSGSSTATIGLIIGDIANSFYSGITAAVSEVAREFDTHVITASTEEDPELEREIALDLCLRRVDGLIIVPSGGDQSYLSAELELGTPMVFVDRPATGIDADDFLLDNRGGARFGVERLLAEGHTRIGVVIDSLDIYTMRERLAGVREALGSRELPIELLSTAAHTPASAAEAAATMLDSDDPPTAFFAGNNRATIGVVETLWRSNREARVVGFDDFELSDFLPRPVSLISYDVGLLGASAARQLFERIAGGGGATSSTRMPFTLVDWGSAR
jgi:LacI family transcriptional regulator